MKRRTFIKSAAAGAGSLGIAYAAGGAISNLVSPALATTDSSQSFSRPLPIPPLDTGLRDGNQVKFKLQVQSGTSNFIGDLSTPTLGINGDYLGPVLRARRGDRVSFEIKNTLPDITTLHWHGFVLPARMDGGPHQVIQPGDTWRPEFDIVQAASTNWFHSHTHRLTGDQVYHGLAGMFIIDDDVSMNAGLPMDYGVDDIPLVIQDRRFSRNGHLRYLGSMPDRMRGMLGDTILVNGAVTPTLKAERSLIRLRLLNGSNARIYDLAFQDNRSFSLVAVDGGFLPAPLQLQRLRLSPGERAEILLDLSDGQDAILLNRADVNVSRGRMGMGGMMSMMGGGSDQPFYIMKIAAPASSSATVMPIPQALADLPNWDNITPVTQRQFRLEMPMGPRMMMSNMFGGSPFSINGESMDMDVINVRVKANTFEIWEIGNASMLAHPFHIHDTQFRVLARSGGGLLATERGLKDTVLIEPMGRVRLLVPFPEYTDAERPYMYHCHILEHEDGGMMGQFTVEA